MVKHKTKKAVSRYILALLVISVCGLKVASATVQEKSAQSRPRLLLQSSKTEPVTITAEVNNATTEEVAAEFSRELGVPIKLSPSIAKLPIKLKVENLSLDQVLPMLAPQVYADYVYSGVTSPKCLVVYLQSEGDTPPASGSPSSIMEMSGEMEAGDNPGGPDDKRVDRAKQVKTEETDGPVLRVTYEQGLLSVHARQQPLAVILNEIAGKVGISFELSNELGRLAAKAQTNGQHPGSNILVEAELINYTLQQAVASLSPESQLYVRIDLRNRETKALRLVGPRLSAADLEGGAN